MRIAYLVAGAGRMYCGACMRDNRVAATLMRQGRDAVLTSFTEDVMADRIWSLYRRFVEVKLPCPPA